ncbi:MAG: DUF805 domain-containing protein [Burkholderiaceae bacterium]
MQRIIGLFSFRGTLSRGEYWAGLLLGWLLFDSLHRALAMWLPAGWLPAGQVLLAALAVWAALSLSVRRLHDRALSAMCLLAILIPVIGGLWLLMQLIFLGAGRHRRLASRSALAWRPPVPL